jgi:NAD(P)-dependent dehydrogenase (short-subunit alcohol dehydrogenase family)
MDAVPRDTALQGSVTIITGAGRGIGRGGAVGLARRGARVAMIDVVPEELETTLALVRAEGAEAMGLIADLRRRDEIDRALDRVTTAWGPVDALMNNAGVLHNKLFEDTTPEVWDETIDVLLNAVYYLTWRVYASMLPRGRGRIFTMSSRAGVMPFAYETAYCAGKWALEGMMRSLALEATGRGIVVTLGSPGRKTKPTSMTDAQFAALPQAQRVEYADPIVFAEGFGYLAAAADPALSGRRIDVFALAEAVREGGWGIPGWLALQRAERNTA